MLKIDLTKQPDLTDIADDDVRAITDIEVRDALYRVTEKLKAIIEWQRSVIDQQNAAIVELQGLV